jgi:hypothetical protein
MLESVESGEAANERAWLKRPAKLGFFVFCSSAFSLSHLMPLWAAFLPWSMIPAERHQIGLGE